MPGIDDDCAGCGHRHAGADGTVVNPWPLIEFTRPEVYLRMNPWEQVLCVRSTDTPCLIENGPSVDCSLTGYLPLTVLGEGTMLVYMPWAQVSEADYLDPVEHWEHPHFRGDYRGTPAGVLPGCENSLSVPVRVIAPGRRPPLIVLGEAAGHTLVREEQEGISRQEAELRIRSMLREDPEL